MSHWPLRRLLTASKQVRWRDSLPPCRRSAYADAALKWRVVFVGAPLAGTSFAAAPRLKSALDLITNIADVLRTASDLASANPLFLATSGLLRVVGDLCDLLTLGLGTLVNWIHCDSCDTGGEVVSSYHYAAITKPFADSHPLVCRSIPGDLERFVEGCYPRFHELRDDRELHALTHAVAEARGHGFLDPQNPHRRVF